MTSIHFNSGSSTALQLLGGAVQEKEQVQQEVATGKEINSAKDQAALWAITQVMESDAMAYGAVSESLSLNEATTSVAAFGAERATEILTEMKELAIMGASGLVDFAKIEEQMAQKTESLNNVISSTQFNGVNLLKSDIDGSGNSSMTVAEAVSRNGSSAQAGLASFSVESLDFEGSADFDINDRTTITDSASAQTALGEIEGFLNFAIEGAARMGAATSRIANQNEFVGKLADATRSGISALQDANIEDVATRLKAASVKVQLGQTSLAIANASPQTLLAIS
ncbi:flagellin [Pseudophaeobacter sp.]|uniref:flagellin N-terminal helical domain-containing protein n=1 Tax=Pseudophaeobacter sp. TaxID=1971739 RepID=UPI00329728D0